MTGELEIRRAVPGDAGAGARFHLRCWQEAYAEIMPARALARFTAEESEWVRRWTAQIEGGVPRHLALRDGEIVGFAAAGIDRESGSDVPVLFAIYVATTEYGRGTAQGLLEASIGAGPATLWVFEANARARSFYARNGFVPSGRTELVEELGAPEIEMVRPAS